MADDDIEDMDFDDDCDVLQGEIDYVDTHPSDVPSTNATRELEKRLEMKRLREQLDDDFYHHEKSIVISTEGRDLLNFGGISPFGR